ncbi:hypothetical protein D3C80_1696180 [compost metagenome]
MRFFLRSLFGVHFSGAFAQANPAQNQQDNQYRDRRHSERTIRVVKRHQDQHAREERQRQPRSERCPRHFEGDVFRAAFFNRGTQFHLTDDDESPGTEDAE